MRDDIPFQRWCAVCIGLILLTWSGTAAAVPMTVTHQGRLLDDSGEPMTGQVQLQFALHTSKTEDEMIWNSPRLDQDLGDSGFYSVVLGRDNPIDSEKLKGKEVWIELTVTRDGNSQTLSPRLKLHSVPYAVRAGLAESVADGAVDSNALAEGAVETQQVAAIAWEKLENVPDGLADGDNDTLGNLNCNSDQLIVYDGQQWTCRASGNFARADQACQGDRVVNGIDSQGNVQCVKDSDTTYQAGGGLKLNGQQFQLQGQTCPSGRVATGIDANGALQCAPDQDTDTTYAKNCSSGEVVGGLMANGDVICVSYAAGAGLNMSDRTFSLASMSCPAGEVARAVRGGSLECVAQNDGDITGVQGGQGLDGGSASGDVQLSVDYGDVQQRVTGDCSGDQFVVAINEDGSVQCSSAGSGGGGTPGSGNDPVAVTSSQCGTFYPAQVCPSGNNDGPSCSSAGVGTFCEADGCDNLEQKPSGGQSDVDNCGIYDWFFKESN